MTYEQFQPKSMKTKGTCKRKCLNSRISLASSNLFSPPQSYPAMGGSRPRALRRTPHSTRPPALHHGPPLRCGVPLLEKSWLPEKNISLSARNPTQYSARNVGRAKDKICDPGLPTKTVEEKSAMTK